MSFRIQLDASVLHQSKAGSITAGVWLESDGACFPSRGWSDFAVVLLGWWVRTFRGLSTQGGGAFEFMDGPYRVEFARLDDGFRADCIEDRRTEVVRQSWLIKEHELESELTRASREVLAECRARGWVSEDIGALESELRALLHEKPSAEDA